MRSVGSFANRYLVFAALLFSMVFSSSAWAKKDEGLLVSIEVRDVDSNEIVKTAVVRHPKEQVRHAVNTETGRWTDSVLFMADGSELTFTKGMVLTFEISAPGYVNETRNFIVRKRKNVFPVYLRKLTFSLEEDYESDPNISFGRDRPLDK